MSICDWPKNDRPRERLLEFGCDKLTDTELLAILIQNGTKNISSVDCARQLIQTFGNIKGIIDAERILFYQQPGLGPAKYALLQAGAELGRRYLKQMHIGKGAITSADHAQQYFRYALGNKKDEHIALLYLSAAHDILHYEEPFQGNTNKVILQFRNCIQKALQLNASAIIMAHNHPNGLAKPSQADIDTTYDFLKALKLVDIALLDHIIIGGKHSFSMRENGLLEKDLYT